MPSPLDGGQPVAQTLNRETPSRKAPSPAAASVGVAVETDGAAAAGALYPAPRDRGLLGDPLPLQGMKGLTVTDGSGEPADEAMDSEDDCRWVLQQV